MIRISRILHLSAFLLVIFFLFSGPYALAAPEIPKIGFSIEGTNTPQDVAASLQIIFLLSILSLAPSILIMMTSFTRVIIVLSFVRNALGTQQMPPNQVLIGLALFLTFFIMSPVINEVNVQAYQPFANGQISQDEAIDRTMVPLRDFMFKQTYKKDLNLFLSLSKSKSPATLEEIPSSALIPAFIISEMKRAFQMGFLIYIPFIMIDMIVASTLMSMGMMMLPPIMISLPFKILLFIMVDGWNLVVKTLITSFK